MDHGLNGNVESSRVAYDSTVWQKHENEIKWLIDLVYRFDVLKFVSGDNGRTKRIKESKNRRFDND